jgi:hypothetical protein
VFPAQPWRATHAIVASAFGYHGGVVGVTATSGEGLRVLLLVPEGLVVFEAVQSRSGSGGLSIKRAVPPLDRSDLASLVMADLGTAFLPPAGQPDEIAATPAGGTVCRWRPNRHEATELELRTDGSAQIRSLRNAKVMRQIELAGAAERGFFPHATIAATGPPGYRLDLALVEHD